jgi:hypothetical protein
MGVVQQFWTAEMVTTLQELWFKDGWSAAKIAEHINKLYPHPTSVVTRNSVISKAHRSLGYTAKNVRAVGSGNLVSAAPKLPKPHKSYMRPRATPHPPVEPLPPDDVIIGVTLMDLEYNSCRWVCAAADEPIYCGRAQEKDKPYCAAHALRAKAQPRVRSTGGERGSRKVHGSRFYGIAPGRRLS